MKCAGGSDALHEIRADCSAACVINDRPVGFVVGNLTTTGLWRKQVSSDGQIVGWCLDVDMRMIALPRRRTRPQLVFAKTIVFVHHH